MIPRSHALVPQLPEQEAAAKAIIYVEEKGRKIRHGNVIPVLMRRRFSGFCAGKEKFPANHLTR